MADLIIQPKNDDHLKLNNDAGTTILEFVNDESKLRLAQNNISASDGTTAITTSGANITLAGTANNIGTVTAGTLGSSVVFPAGGTGNAVSVAVLADKKAYTTEGGTFNKDAWRTRDINYENDPDNIVTYANSTSGTAGGGSSMGQSFTLIAGTYLITWMCPVYDIVRHITRLYDITGGAELTTGTSQTNEPKSHGSFIHTISSSNTYEIQHMQETNNVASIGFGLASDITTNVYTLINIFKIK